MRARLLERVPWFALIAFVVGLPLHNFAMAELWDAGVRGTWLDAIAAWKDILLILALGAVLWRAQRLPLALAADKLALLFAAVVILYGIVPQSWLGGEATARGELLALRHDLIPVGAYFFGRLLELAPREWRRLGLALAIFGIGLSLFGLADVYLVPLNWWRESGVPAWYHEQLGFTYTGLSGLPENWVLNTGDETNPVRRLVGPFLSPLAAAYALAIVLLYLAARRPTRWVVAAGAMTYAGLLWTHTRAAYLALAAGFALLAIVRRRWLPVILAVASIGIGAAFVKAFPDIGPSTRYTTHELEVLRANARRNPGVSNDPFSAGESSTSSHLRNLRDGIELVIEHPQGHGLGNTGASASRSGAKVLAGESTYTELGVDTGVAGMAFFVAWVSATLVALWRRRVWLVAVWAVVLLLGMQTDVIGVHWIAYVVFALAGATLTRPDELEPLPVTTAMKPTGARAHAGVSRFSLDRDRVA